MSATLAAPLPPARPLDLRSALWQALVLVLVAAVLGWFVANAAANLARLGLQLGFGFLDRPAGFRMGETLLAYEPRDSYGRAMLAGFVNTLRVAVLGIVLATVLGVAVGILRLSRNPLLAALSSLYVELVRNTPVLLQLVLWHALILRLPPVRGAVEPLPFVFLSQRGLNLPWPEADHGLLLLGLGALLALGATLAFGRLFRRRRARTGRAPPLWPVAIALFAALPVLGTVVAGTAPVLTVPRLQGFNFVGGAAMTPEYAALLFGLVVYGAAFIGEIVRQAIQAIGAGQWDAGRALGLREARTLRLVVLPQALRLMLPPLTNQYVNLAKNTALGVVVGFPEFASVVNTAINQTGQALEALALFMAVFLALSLAISAFMNWANARLAVPER